MFSPEAFPTWKRVGNKPLPLSHSFLNWGRTLRIDRVEHADEDKYTCEFGGTLSSASRQIELHVEAAPYFTEQPRSRNSSEGETETFVCGAIGRPNPSFRFYKNGKRKILE